MGRSLCRSKYALFSILIVFVLKSVQRRNSITSYQFQPRFRRRFKFFLERMTQTHLKFESPRLITTICFRIMLTVILNPFPMWLVLDHR